MILLKITNSTSFFTSNKYRGEAIAGFYFYNTPWHFGTQMKPFSKSNIKVHPCNVLVCLFSTIKGSINVCMYRLMYF